MQPNEILHGITTGDPVAIFMAIFITCFAGLLLWLLYGIVYVGEKCPQCQRKRVLQQTGKTEMRELLGRRGKPVEWEHFEWLCRHCGHMGWKRIPPPSGH